MGGAGGIGRGKELEAGAEAGGVLVGDGEDAVAALGASGAADQLRAAAERGGGQGGVDDLDEVGTSRFGRERSARGGYPLP